jgi:mycofactocin system glycosyltransferase
MIRRFALDSSYRRPRRGRVVVGGSPLRLFTLSQGGVRVMVAIEQGDELPAGHERLTDRLVDRGVLHPLPDPPAPDVRSRLTVVIPAHAALPRFRPRSCRTIVVDDASPHPLEVGDAPDVEVIRLAVNAGPGGARNAGLAMVDTDLVAFVDTDVDVDEDALVALCAHFDDQRVALVAPRVGAADAPGPLAAFERRHSPLDRGPEPARVAAGTRVSFVPGAVLVCRADAVRSVGGFDAALRFGEDVDLAWRLGDAGFRCRYEPAASAGHLVRPHLRGWLRQRAGYGSSAAPLAQRHPGALAPMRMSGWSAAVWVAIGAGFPLTGAAIGAGTAAALARKLDTIPKSESVRLALSGHLHAGRLVASSVTRVWWPVAVALAVVSRRARRAVALAAIGPALIDWWNERPDLGPGRYTVLHVLDDLAYGAGVWQGSLATRSAGALLPAFEPWPPPGPGRGEREG